MADQSTASTSSPASPPSVPPARDPSPGVRVTQQIREAVTDLGGLALAAYLVSRGAITGQHALLFALALLLPSPLLLRLAKVLGARGSSAGAGVAVAMLSASATWAKVKGVAVLALGISLLTGCPIPPPDGCPPRATRCSPSGVPQSCTLGQYWSSMRPERPCSAGSVCCYTRSPYGRELHACVPPEDCLPEPAAVDAGVEGGAQ